MKYRSILEELAAYVPGKPIEDVKKEFGLDKIVKLASNENPYGCSKTVPTAINNGLQQALYPDGNCTELRMALSKKLNINAERFVFGAGSNEIISLIAQIYLEPGDESIFAVPSFIWYDYAVKVCGATPVKIPLDNFKHDLDAMYNAITDKTKIIWLCNPNNPTGTMFTLEEQVKFLKKVPKNIIVVLDEAYYEYVTNEDYPETLDLLDEYKNIIVLRTFSKIYGLASLRVGYGIVTAEMANYINRVRPPFNVNSAAQLAACAAIEDTAFVAECKAKNTEQKDFLYNELSKLGLTFIKSETNFIWVNAGRDEKEFFTELLKKGVIIRPIFNNFVRITVGTHKENLFLLKQLKTII